MADYNLGTASGRIIVDGSGAELGFNVARTAAGAFFDVVKMRVNQVQQLGRRMAAVGATGATFLGAAIHTAADFEQAMSGVYAVAGANEEQMEALRQKAMQLGADTVYSASEAAQALEELVKAGISVEDVLNGAADATTSLAAAGGIGIPEAATIAANAMNQFELSGRDVAKVADILAGVANTSAADVSALGQSLSQSGAVANLAGLSFRDTAIALGEMADAGIQGSDAGTSLKTMLNNLIPTTTRQIDKFMELKLLTYDLATGNKVLAKEHLPLQKNIDGVYKVLGKYMEELDKGAVGTQKNAKAVQDLMLKTGILNNEFFDAQGNVKNLVGLQGTLSKALKGLTKEQKLNTLETLFGTDAMRASAILSLEGAKGYRQFSKDVAKTSAADVAAIRLDNLRGSTEQLKGSLETAAISIGSVFLPVITHIVDALTYLVNVFNGLPGPVKTGIAILTAFMSAGLLVFGLLLAFLPAIIGFVANFLLMRAIGTVIGGFRVFFATLRGGQGILLATSAGARSTAVGMTTLGKRTLFAGKMLLFFGRMAAAAWALATGPIGIAVLAIAALIAVGVLLYKKWKPFHDLIDQIARVLKAEFLAAWAKVRPVLLDAWDALKKFGDYFVASIMPVLKQVGSLLMGTLLDGWKSITKAVADDLMPALRDLGDTLQNDVGPSLQKLWGYLGPVVAIVAKAYIWLQLLYLKGFLLIGKVLISYVLPILIRVAAFMMSGFLKALVGMVEGAIQFVSGIIKVFDGIIEFIKGVFAGDWGAAWDGLKKSAGGILDIIQGLFKLAMNGILGFALAGMKYVYGVITGWLGKADDSTGGILSSIVDFFVNAFETVRSVVTTVIGFIAGFFKFQLNAVQTLWQKYWGTFGGYLTAVFKLVISIVNLFWVVVKGLFLLGMQALWNLIKVGWNVVTNLFKIAFVVIRAIVTNGFGIIKAVVTTGMNLIRNVFRAVWNVVAAIVGAIWDRIGGRVKSGANRMYTLAKAGLDLVLAGFRLIWDKVLKVVIEKITAVVERLMNIKGKIDTIFADAGTWLVDKGKALIQGLIDGITSMIGKVGGAIDSIAGEIGKRLPGSPVKEGPLVKWNKGRSGKKLMDMLGEGLQDTHEIEQAMKAATMLVDSYMGQMRAAAMASNFTFRNSAHPTFAEQNAAHRSARRAAETKRMVGAAVGADGAGRTKVLEGSLSIDDSGRAWIEGIAQDVIDDDNDWKNNHGG